MNLGITILQLIISVCQVNYYNTSFSGSSLSPQKTCIKETIVCVETSTQRPYEYALQECLKK